MDPSRSSGRAGAVRSEERSDPDGAITELMYGHELVAALRASLDDPDLATTESIPRREHPSTAAFGIEDGTFPPATQRLVAVSRETTEVEIVRRAPGNSVWRGAALLVLWVVFAVLSVASMLAVGATLLFSR